MENINLNHSFADVITMQRIQVSLVINVNCLSFSDFDSPLIVIILFLKNTEVQWKAQIVTMVTNTEWGRNLY